MTADPDPEDSWFLYRSQAEDEIHSIAVNLGLGAPDPELPHVTRIEVPLRSRRGYVFTPEEGAVLDAITDRMLVPPPPTLLGRLKPEPANRVVFVGRVTVRSVSSLYFYSEREIPKRHSVALERAAPRQSFDAGSAHDPEWGVYFRELHPGAALAALITSHAQVALRREDGDQLSVPRNVDHTLAFPDAASRDAFVADAGAVLRIRLYEIDGPAERRFFVDLTFTHDVTESTTDTYVVGLSSHAEAHGGAYDGWGAEEVKGLSS